MPHLSLAGLLLSVKLERVHPAALGVGALGAQQLLHVLLDHVARADEGIPGSEQGVVQRHEPLDVEGDEVVRRVRRRTRFGQFFFGAGRLGSLGRVAILLQVPGEGSERASRRGV